MNEEIKTIFFTESCIIIILFIDSVSHYIEHTVGPCAVQNPTALETFRGKLGKAHCDSALGHNSDLSILSSSPHPVTTKMWRAVKERDLKCFKIYAALL